MAHGERGAVHLPLGAPVSDGTSNQSPLCPSCGWPIARHVTPCPPELPLEDE